MFIFRRIKLVGCVDRLRQWWNQGQLDGSREFGVTDYLKMRGNYVIFSEKNLAEDSEEEIAREPEVLVFDRDQSRYFKGKIAVATPEQLEERNSGLIIVDIKARAHGEAETKHFVISYEEGRNKFVGHILQADTPLPMNYFVLTSLEKRKIKYNVESVDATLDSTMSGVGGLKYVKQGATLTGIMVAFFGRIFSSILPDSWQPKISEVAAPPRPNRVDPLLEIEALEGVEHEEQLLPQEPENNEKSFLKGDVKKYQAMILWLVTGMVVAGTLAGLIFAPGAVLPMLAYLPLYYLIPGFVGVVLVSPLVIRFAIFLWQSGGVGLRFIGEVALLQQAFGNWIYDTANREDITRLGGLARNICVPVFFITSIITGFINQFPKIFSKKSPFDEMDINNSSNSKSLKWANRIGRLVSNWGRVSSIAIVGTIGTMAFMALFLGGPTAALPIAQAMAWGFSNVIFFYLPTAWTSFLLPSLIQFALSSPLILGISLAISGVLMTLLLYPILKGLGRMTMDAAFDPEKSKKQAEERSRFARFCDWILRRNQEIARRDEVNVRASMLSGQSENENPDVINSSIYEPAEEAVIGDKKSRWTRFWDFVLRRKHEEKVSQLNEEFHLNEQEDRANRGIVANEPRKEGVEEDEAV